MEPILMERAGPAAEALAQEVETRRADLVVAVQRWSSGLADNVDAITAELAELEEGLAADADEVTRARARRRLHDALLDLAGLCAALHLGPPECASYRLRALVQLLAADGDALPGAPWSATSAGGQGAGAPFDALQSPSTANSSSAATAGMPSTCASRSSAPRTSRERA